MSAELDMKILTKLAIASMKSSIRTMTRIIHLNLKKSISHVPCTDDCPTYPISSTKFLATIGMTVPPNDAPVVIIPDANDLRFLNHCAQIAGIGQKSIPQADPVRRP